MAEAGRRKLLPWAGVAAVALALALATYWLLFTTFMLYDDEGYVLLSLRNFSLHGALYDQVYTQYGPFPYLCYDALHRVFRFAFDNTSGRWITWINWLCTAALCGGLVGRVTRSALWTAFTFAAVVSYLGAMIKEPVHPGGLTTLLIAVAACGGAELWSAGRSQFFAAGAGLFAAALLLTKINVGVFFVAASATWFAITSASPQGRRALTWAAALSCASLPYLLMRSLWHERWVQVFALIFSAAALGTILAGTRAVRPVATVRTWCSFAVATALGILGLCLLTVARGTTWHGLLDGVMLEPLRHPGVYSFAMNWRTGSGLLALASLAIAAWAGRGAHWSDSRFCATVAWTRLGATLLFLCSLVGLIPISAPAWGMAYGLSLAWWFVLPLQPNERSANARCWIALLLVFQALHAFPVSGSQISWGTYLWVPLLAMGMHDAAPVLAAQLGSGRIWAARLGIAGVLAGTLVISGKLFQVGWTRYSTSEPLLLKGAENLRLPDSVTYALRIVDENLRAHGDVLFSAPGLYSANLSSGLPTPTLANATLWFSLLSDAQQQAIIDRLAVSDRPLLLIQRGLLDYLMKDGFAVRCPLQTWLRMNFEPAFEISPYEIWVKKGRSIAPLSTVQLLPTQADGAVALNLTMAAPRNPVAQIEIRDLANLRAAVFVADATNATATVTPITPDGKPLSAPQPATFPLGLSGTVQITLRLKDPACPALGPRSLLILRGHDGETLGALRLLAR